MNNFLDRLDPRAVGIKLYRFTGNDVRACELVVFERGRIGVDTVLRRAAISGRVEIEPYEDSPDYVADIYIDPHTWTQSVALDRGSFRALKYHWMRCNYEANE